MPLPMNNNQLAPLTAVASSMPEANQRRAEQRKAAQDIQLQQAVAAAKPASAINPTAASLGRAMQQNAGQQAIAQAQKNLQQNNAMGNAALQQQQQQVANQISSLKQGLEASKLSDVDRLANLSAQAKREVWDSRLQFSRDEMGREFLNTRQMADYAAKHARDVEQLRDYSQTAQQLNDRSIYALEEMSKVVQQRMEYEAARDKQFLDSEAAKRMLAQQDQIRSEIAKAKANASRDAAIWGAATTIVGAAVAAS